MKNNTKKKQLGGRASRRANTDKYYITESTYLKTIKNEIKVGFISTANKENEARRIVEFTKDLELEIGRSIVGYKNLIQKVRAPYFLQLLRKKDTKAIYEISRFPMDHLPKISLGYIICDNNIIQTVSFYYIDLDEHGGKAKNEYLLTDTRLILARIYDEDIEKNIPSKPIQIIEAFNDGDVPFRVNNELDLFDSTEVLNIEERTKKFEKYLVGSSCCGNNITLLLKYTDSDAYYIAIFTKVNELGLYFFSTYGLASKQDIERLLERKG